MSCSSNGRGDIYTQGMEIWALCIIGIRTIGLSGAILLHNDNFYFHFFHLNFFNLVVYLESP